MRQAGAASKSRRRCRRKASASSVCRTQIRTEFHLREGRKGRANARLQNLAEGTCQTKSSWVLTCSSLKTGSCGVTGRLAGRADLQRAKAEELRVKYLFPHRHRGVLGKEPSSVVCEKTKNRYAGGGRTKKRGCRRLRRQAQGKLNFTRGEKKVTTSMCKPICRGGLRKAGEGR